MVVVAPLLLVIGSEVHSCLMSAYSLFSILRLPSEPEPAVSILLDFRHELTRRRTGQATKPATMAVIGEVVCRPYIP